MEFKGMVIGGSVCGGWIEADEPVKKIFKREILAFPIAGSPEVAADIHTETYVYVSGVHGKGVQHRWNNYWVPKNKAKFTNGQYSDQGWGMNKVMAYYLKYAGCEKLLNVRSEK